MASLVLMLGIVFVAIWLGTDDQGTNLIVDFLHGRGSRP